MTTKKKRPLKLVQFRIRSLDRIQIGYRRRINGVPCFAWIWFGPACKRTQYVDVSECDIIQEPYTGVEQPKN